MSKHTRRDSFLPPVVHARTLLVGKVLRQLLAAVGPRGHLRQPPAEVGRALGQHRGVHTQRVHQPAASGVAIPTRTRTRSCSGAASGCRAFPSARSPALGRAAGGARLLHAHRPVTVIIIRRLVLMLLLDGDTRGAPDEHSDDHVGEAVVAVDGRGVRALAEAAEASSTVRLAASGERFSSCKRIGSTRRFYKADSINQSIQAARVLVAYVPWQSAR